MTKIIYVARDGSEQVVDAKNGESVMQAAVRNSIPGIAAECGGACACGTCHIYVESAFFEKMEKPGDIEQAMLDFAENIQDNSRLSCQVVVSDELNGLRVTVPAD